MAQLKRRIFTRALIGVVGFGIWALAPALAAQESEPPQRQDTADDTEEIVAEIFQEIVVTGTLPDFLEGEAVVDARQLQRQGARDLAAALREEAGLSAVRRGAVNLEPTVRGLQETQVGMFVDGTRTFAAGPARMDSDLSHVSPHAVETVRVVKGPYALAWGAGTLSAVEVTTFEPEFRTEGAEGFDLGGRVSAGFGDNTGAQDVYGGFWGSNERWRFSLLHNHRQGDDYEDGSGGQVPGDYESDDSRWTVGTRIGNATLSYRGGYQRQDDLDYPGRILDASFFVTRSHALAVDWHSPGAAKAPQVYAQVYVNGKDHRMNNDEKPTAQPMAGRTPPFALDVAVLTESDTTGGSAFVEWDSVREGVRYKVGTDYYRLEQNADRTVARREDDRVLFRDVVWPDAERENLGVYGQSVYRTTGYGIGWTVRADRIESSAGRPSDFFLARTTGDLSSGDTEFSGAVSNRSRITDRWVVSLGLGRAVRPADTLERYSDRFPSTKFQLPAEFLGNPALEPEASFEVDVGTEGRIGTGLLEVSLFTRRIDDYITVVADPAVPKRLPLSPPVVYRYVNGERATFRGGEVRWSDRFGEDFSWFASLESVWAEDEELNEPVLGIAPTTARLGVRWQPAGARWWTGATLTAADDQDRVAVSRFESPTPGWETLDLRGGYRFANGLEVRAGVENVTDEQVVQHLNAKNPFTGQRIAEPGRDIYLGVSYDF